MRQQHEGLVELGDLTAHATWTDGEFLLIRFSTGPLDPDQLRTVNFLKLYPHPVSLVLDGKRATGVNRIIGFEEKSGGVTFHVVRG